MARAPTEENGRTLLSAVERVLASTDSLVALAHKFHESAKLRATGEEKIRRSASTAAIAHFSNRAAAVGLASTLTAQIPGIGSLAAMATGALLDATFLLKWEVELALVLADLHGFDIRDNEERQLAFLMASVSTYDAQTGKNILVDVLDTEREALWNYSSRRMGKAIAEVFAMLALARLGRAFLKLIPLVGPVVGAAGNKLLTRRVGQRCEQDFETRRRLLAKKPRAKVTKLKVVAKPAKKRPAAAKA